MTRRYARAPRGERVYGKVPRLLYGKNTTLLASMGFSGMGPCFAIEGGTTTKAVFETYVERVLAPSLSQGQVVVLDNLSAHKKGYRVRELVEGRGCEFCSCRPTRLTSRPSRRLSPRPRPRLLPSE